MEDNGKDIATPVPRLIPVFGRTGSSVQKMIEYIENNPERITRDFLKLLSDVCYTRNMNFRNYVIAKYEHGHKILFNHGQEYTGTIEKRPLWFVFPGEFIQVKYTS